MKKVSLTILVMGFALLWLRAMNTDEINRFFSRRLPSSCNTDYFLASWLLEAAIEGNLEKVERSVAKGADVNTTSLVGRTSLHEAAYGGHYKIVQFLIEKRANFGTKDKDGNLPMNLAEQRGFINIVKLLFTASANKDKQK